MTVVATVVVSTSIVCFALALLPAMIYLANRRLYAMPETPVAGTVPSVSVLIPARNEEAGIAACVAAALASRGVELEVVVLDDHSEDRTREVVAGIAVTDARVRIELAPPLPDGWCGKQHACHVLASLARHPNLAFIDADVRLEPDGLARAVAFRERGGAALVSGVPRQVTGTFLERLLIPLIHFVLLGYLPVARMRASTQPAYGAGCGQLFITSRDAYDRVGGHAMIRATLHDGISLPRAYRKSGLTTDLFDATPIASCRMYQSASEVWYGLAKNATEGMAARAAIVPWTVLLLGGQVMPVVLLAALTFTGLGSLALVASAGLCAAAVAASYAIRLDAAMLFRQSIFGAVLHPIGVIALVAIQWFALLRDWSGVRPSWRGRRCHNGATPNAGASIS